METNEQIYTALLDVKRNLQSDDLATRVQDGMPAAELHAFYNQVGVKEGWLKPEYAKPLSGQDPTNQAKNIDAALDVIDFWEGQYDSSGRQFDLEGEMKAAVDYEANRGRQSLEAAADSQHSQWRRFVETYQKERITPGHEKFRQSNYDQFNTGYADLEEGVKDQDRLIVAVISDVVLGLAGIGYKRKIDTSGTFG